MENLNEEKRSVTRGKIEIPPPGYTGSLKGTSWDPDEMIKDYEANAQ